MTALALHTGARFPHPPRDPYFSDVLLLCNGAGLTVDSSRYNRSLSTGGSIALNGTHPLNGFNTYNTPAGSALFLSTTDHNDILSLLGAEEWCIEWWLKVVSYVASRRTIVYSPGIFFDTGLSTGDVRFAAYINGTPYVVGPSASSLTSGTFKHCALIRDNTSDANWSRLHFALDGVVGITSTANIPKADAMSTSAAFNFMGYDSFSPPVAFGGFRVTRNTRRYLTNVQGAPVNTFEPNVYPFLGE